MIEWPKSGFLLMAKLLLGLEFPSVAKPIDDRVALHIVYPDKTYPQHKEVSMERRFDCERGIPLAIFKEIMQPRILEDMKTYDLPHALIGHECYMIGSFDPPFPPSNHWRGGIALHIRWYVALDELKSVPVPVHTFHKYFDNESLDELLRVCK